METVPFPRSQNHEDGFPLELSLKLTTKGAQPAFVSELKSALNWAFNELTKKKKNMLRAQYLLALKNKKVKKVKFFKYWIIGNFENHL